MQLINELNTGNRFLLVAIDIFKEYKWVFLLKDRNFTAITKAFQEILNESSHNPKKIQVDKGSKFYNRSIKSLLQDNHIEMYSTHNEGKSVIAKILIRILKNKIYKHMTSVLKMCILSN